MSLSRILNDDPLPFPLPRHHSEPDTDHIQLSAVLHTPPQPVLPEWPRETSLPGHDAYPDLQHPRYMSPDNPDSLTRKRRKNTNDDSSHSSTTSRRVSRPISLIPAFLTLTHP